MVRDSASIIHILANCILLTIISGPISRSNLTWGGKKACAHSTVSSTKSSAAAAAAAVMPATIVVHASFSSQKNLKPELKHTCKLWCTWPPDPLSVNCGSAEYIWHFHLLCGIFLIPTCISPKNVTLNISATSRLSDITYQINSEN